MLFNPKYHAKEPIMKPTQNPRVGALEESKRKFEQTQKQLTMLRGRDMHTFTEDAMDLQNPPKSPDVALMDDDVDVWHRGRCPKSYRSTTDFTAVTNEDDYEHPVPCGDDECDHCYVLSVVSDFDDDDGTVALAHLLPSVSASEPVVHTFSVSVSEDSTEIVSTTSKEISHPEMSQIVPRSNSEACSSNTQELYPKIEIYESPLEYSEIKPVKVTRINPTQEALADYMETYTAQKCTTQYQGQSYSPVPRSRDQLRRIMSFNHSMIENKVRSPLDRFQDKLAYLSIASEASFGLVSPTHIENLGASRVSSLSNEDQKSSVPGAWVLETQRLLCRVGDVKRPPSDVLPPFHYISGFLQLPETRRSIALDPTRPSCISQSLSREYAKRLNIAPGKLSTASRKHIQADPGAPRIGKGSRPPLSLSSYCNGESTCATGDCAECKIMASRIQASKAGMQHK